MNDRKDKNKNNYESAILSKIKDEAVISIYSFCEFIYFIKRKVPK